VTDTEVEKVEVSGASVVVLPTRPKRGSSRFGTQDDMPVLNSIVTEAEAEK